MISHEQREQVTVAILQSLDAVHPNGLTAHSLMTPLKLSGLTLLERADVESLLSDMQEAGHVKLAASKLASEVKRFVRTDAGRVLLREAGL